MKLSCHSVPRLRQRAFTLVELLVVVGIIALLIGILLPVLSKARESANRTKCAANLRSIGQAAHVFASQHNGYFPRAFITGTGNPMPSDFDASDERPPGLTQGIASYMQPYYSSQTTDNYNKTFGLRLSEWRQYGLNVGEIPDAPAADWQQMSVDQSLFGVLACPSVDSSVHHVTFRPPPGSEWPYKVIRTDYVYVGGLPSGPARNASDPGVRNAGGTLVYSEPHSLTMSVNRAGDFVNTPLLPIAVTTGDDNLSDRLLAMDRVYMETPATSPLSNHGALFAGAPGKLPFMPKFVNVLYGDGHVDGKIGRDHYQTQWLDGTNQSMQHATNDHLFWLGPTKNTANGR
jgi:prepilin-type N-terminal cleavage/methylation domain-containing protein/prepilin-type processing-associated H-X9-DG protein